MDNMINSTVFGNWKVTELIGEGGFGKVYKIEREDFGIHNVAALKVLTVPCDSSEEKELENDGLSREETEKYLIELVEDTVREVALMCELKGEPNVVGYEDHYVEKVDGSLKWNIFIRMEYLTPMSIYFKENVLNTKTALKLACDICTALETCHENHIIHRDIKPENIFVSRNGDFKLGDFGIARTMEKTVGAFSKKGTYSYMAPEVYSGKDYSDNVDVYSLGLLLYRLFNKNKLPFTALDRVSTYAEREQALLKRMSGAELPAPVEANEDLSQIILKACAFDPEKRYKNASEMKSDILFLIENKTAERTTGPFSMPGFKKEKTVTEETLTNEEFESEQEKTFGPAYKDSEIPTEVSEEEYEWQEDDEKKLSLKKLLIPVAVLVLLFISVFAVSRLNKNKVDVKPTKQTTENVQSKTENNSEQNKEPNTATTAEITSPENTTNGNEEITKATQESENDNSNNTENDYIEKGNSIEWNFDKATGELTISGHGDMEDYDNDNNTSPWYKYAKSIKKVTVNEGVTSIGNLAFYECVKLQRVTIPNGVTRIGDSSFSLCESLTNVIIPESTTVIGDGAFFGVPMTSISIPEGVSSIGSDAFLATEISFLEIPANVIYIGDRAFANNFLITIKVSPDNSYYCNDEHGVLFNKSKTELIQFPGGNDITTYNVPDGVKTIRTGAFEDSIHLEKVTVSKSVEFIGNIAFQGCSNLKEVEVLNKYCKFYEYDDAIFPEETTIYGYKGSTAEKFAKEYNRKFVAL